jgi:hypothetical protein
MSDHTNHETRLREPIRDVPSTTGGSTAFILGALAVAVLVIVWAVLSGVDAPAPTTGDPDITIEAPAAPDPAAPVETAPAAPDAAAPDAAAPDAAAPVETAPAPDDGATAPAAPPASN